MPDSLRIAVAGVGRMGQVVQECALSRGHTIVARFDQSNPVTGDSLGCSPDVIIDFTQPNIAISHITRYCIAGIPAVIGTTGWYDRLSEVEELVRSHQSGVLYSPNYSMGIQILFRALDGLGKLLDQLPEFDVVVQELHHSAKLDSPSGTAIRLAEHLVQGLQRKHKWGESSAPNDPYQLDVVTARIGHVFGQHRIIMDGPADHIVLEHTAKDRSGFALGAVRAAEWIQGRTGFFTLEDMLAEWLATPS